MADDNNAPPLTTTPASLGVRRAGALRDEVATVQRNPFIFPYAGLLYPRDPTLRTRGGGWNYLIYERAEADPRVYSAMQKRKGAVAAFPWELEPASKDPKDVEAKELVERAFDGFAFGAMCNDLLDAILYGFQPTETLWDVVGGELVPVGYKRRDQRRFRYDETEALRMITREALLTGIPVPDHKFVVHRFRVRDGDPYGRGLGEMLFWSAYFKRENQASWLIHNDKYGSPTAWGKHPPGASQQDKDALFEAIQGIQTDAAVMTSSDAEIALLEAQRAAGADTFKTFKDSEDEDIDAIILGSTSAANTGPLDGGAGANVDQGDRLELAQADANGLADTLNTGLIQSIVLLNLPDARPPRIKWNIDAEEDLGARATRDNIVAGWGFEPTEQYVQSTYGGDWKKKAPVVPPSDPLDDDATDETPPAAFAEGKAVPAGVLATQRIAERGGDQAAGVIEGWVGQVRQLMGQVGSLEELRDRLIDVFPNMSGAAFAELMSDALQVGDLAGRYEVRHGDGR